jgi:hypothetical protein
VALQIFIISLLEDSRSVVAVIVMVGAASEVRHTRGALVAPSIAV